jgi:hypothetical protein
LRADVAEAADYRVLADRILGALAAHPTAAKQAG